MPGLGNVKGLSKNSYTYRFTHKGRYNDDLKPMKYDDQKVEFRHIMKNQLYTNVAKDNRWS